MHVGILLCGHTLPEVHDRLGDYDAMFHRLFAGRGWRFTSWSVVDMAFPEEPGAADAWLITGSRHGAYDDLPFIAPLEAFIRRADDSGVPMLGICFGHQIIAQALGGTVRKFDGGWRVGPTQYEIEGLGSVCLTAWHQDQVIVPPPDAKVIASSAFCATAGLAYGSGILTLQPHPEFGRTEAEAYVTLYLDSPAYPDGMLRQVRDRLDTPLDSALTADWLAGFLTDAVDARDPGRRQSSDG